MLALPHWLVASALGLTAAISAAATDPESAASVRTIAEDRYRAGKTHQLLFGSGYRDLWATPIVAPVLDLDGFEGWLTPVAQGGRGPTLSLAFRDAAGRAYRFRSIDKDTHTLLPIEFRGSAAERLLQDETSAQWPAAVLAVDALAEAAGVAERRSRLCVLPDRPRLGEFRSEFAGTLGTLEARTFADASEVREGEAVLRDAAMSVDARAYLRARLLDLLIGDWDRGPDHWQWVKRAGPLWEPVAGGRDQAFSRYGGLLIGMRRQAAHQPLTSFQEDYGDVVSLVWTGLDMDHRILVGLDWEAWQEETRALEERLGDDVIDRAVRRLPPEHVALRGAFLARALKARRDHLANAARVFYRLLAAHAGTDTPRDWGGSWAVGPWLDIKGDTGVVIGGGLRYQPYGFRETASSSQRVRVAYLTGASTVRGEYAGSFRRGGSNTRVEIEASATGAEVLRYFRPGNETLGLGDDEFHRVEQQAYRLILRSRFALSPSLSLTVGPSIQYTSTSSRMDRLVGQVSPYGSGRFGEVVARADLRWRRENRTAVLPRGVFASAGGSLAPPLLDVARAWGEIHAQAGANIGLRGTTAGVRVGGSRVFGPYPFFEAAFIGGLKDDTTVRGLRDYRYAGDARAYANAEWRVPVFRGEVVVPVDFGILGLADVGRVFLKGESSTRWHVGAGGGIWAAPIRTNVFLSLVGARCEGETGVQFRSRLLF